MRKLIVFSLITIAAITFAMVHTSFSADKCDHNCMQCHKISNEEAVNLLKENIPDVKILEIRPAQVKGLWEFTLETKGQKGIAYIDFSKKYVISGSIFDINNKSNVTQERFSEISKVDVAQVPLDDALVLGDKGAKYRVIVFSDPACPYCGKLHEEMKKVIEKRKDIVFFIKMFPLPMHQGAYEEAKTIVCEKSLELLENAFEKKTIPAPKCDTTAVDNNIKLAEKLGIRGTPAVILPNGIISPGFKDADALISLIDKSK